MQSSYAIAFAAGFALDLLYVAWVHNITQSKPVLAGFASVTIGFAGLVGLGQALHSHVAAVCYLGGLFTGTVTGVFYGRSKQ